MKVFAFISPAHAMQLSRLHYLPISPLFFSVLVGLTIVLVVLLQVHILRVAYRRLGLSSGAAILLLIGSLVGGTINVPVAELPGEVIRSGQEVLVFGIPYVVPAVQDWPGTVIAVNLGGALIPSVMSLYLAAREGLWIRSIVAVAIVALVCHAVATPVPGVGIVLPVFVPAIAGVAAAVLLAWQRRAALAYIGGSVGTLVGADLMNLHHIGGLGAPVASIGGAGTFDGIFVAGVLAVLLASIGSRRETTEQAPR